MRAARWLVVVAVLAVNGAMGGCGGGSSYGGGLVDPCPTGSIEIQVAPSGLAFSPTNRTGVRPGDTVCWNFRADGHDVTSGAPCTADGDFATAGVQPAGRAFTHVFAAAGTFQYFCSVHCGMGMTGTVTVAP